MSDNSLTIRLDGQSAGGWSEKYSTLLNAYTTAGIEISFDALQSLVAQWQTGLTLHDDSDTDMEDSTAGNEQGEPLVDYEQLMQEELERKAFFEEQADMLFREYLPK